YSRGIPPTHYAESPSRVSIPCVSGPLICPTSTENPLVRTEPERDGRSRRHLRSIAELSEYLPAAAQYRLWRARNARLARRSSNSQNGSTSRANEVDCRRGGEGWSAPALEAHSDPTNAGRLRCTAL